MKGMVDLIEIGEGEVDLEGDMSEEIVEGEGATHQVLGHLRAPHLLQGLTHRDHPLLAQDHHRNHRHPSQSQSRSRDHLVSL